MTLKEKIIKLREDGKTYKEIVETLGCSKSVISFHIGEHVGRIEKYCKYCKSIIKGRSKICSTCNSIERFCTVCQEKLSGKKKKFCSGKCKSKYFAKDIIACQKTRGLNKKIEFVKKSGGCCQKCGYKDNLGCLSFHHRNPEEKSFCLDMRALSNYSNELITEEFNKCDLFCMNCHTAHHHPHLDNSQNQLF